MSTDEEEYGANGKIKLASNFIHKPTEWELEIDFDGMLAHRQDLLGDSCTGAVILHREQVIRLAGILARSISECDTDSPQRIIISRGEFHEWSGE